MRTRGPLVALSVLAVVLTGCVPVGPRESHHDRDDVATITGDTTAQDDPWYHYFHAQAEADGDLAELWGSFGLPGEVAPAGWQDESLPAGAHTIAVSCAGAPSIALVVSAFVPDGGQAGEPLLTRSLPCPGGGSVEIATESAGIGVTLDSHGQTGAFLIELDPGSSQPVP